MLCPFLVGEREDSVVLGRRIVVRRRPCFIGRSWIFRIVARRILPIRQLLGTRPRISSSHFSAVTGCPHRHVFLAVRDIRHRVLGLGSSGECNLDLVVGGFTYDIRAARNVVSGFSCSVCVSIFRSGVYRACGLRRPGGGRRVLGGFGVRRFLGLRLGLAVGRLCPRLRGSRRPDRRLPLLRALLLLADPPSAGRPRAGEELLVGRRARSSGSLGGALTVVVSTVGEPVNVHASPSDSRSGDARTAA